MKKRIILFILILIPIISRAYSVEIDGIYYNLNSNNTAEVTYQSTYWGPNLTKEYQSDYSGIVVIPSEIVYDGDTYVVDVIGDFAFSSCSDLTSVTIPNSVTTIGERAFQECTNLTSVSIPNSVTTIDAYAFYDCSSLTSVSIPNRMISISNSTFSYCTNLTTVTIPNSVISIDNNAFFNCSSLTSVIIPNSVISIGDYAFAYCSSLTSMAIPEGVTCIGSAAFWACGILSSVTIPNSVTTLGSSAFYGCPNLTSIISQIENPYAIRGRHSTNQVFDYRLYDKATLYVPLGTIDKYKVTDGWKDFRFIEEMETTYLIQMKTMPLLIKVADGQISVEGAPEGTKVTVYDANGMEMGTAISRGGTTLVPARLASGSIAIVKIGEKAVKISVK